MYHVCGWMLPVLHKCSILGDYKLYNTYTVNMYSVHVIM